MVISGLPCFPGKFAHVQTVDASPFPPTKGHGMRLGLNVLRMEQRCIEFHSILQISYMHEV